MSVPLSLMALLTASVVLAQPGVAQDQPRRSITNLVGCYVFTSGRSALGASSGGGFGTLPPGIHFADSLLFAREGDPTLAMRPIADSDSARRWMPPQVWGSWHPHADSVFASFSTGTAGVALRFRIAGDTLEGMARPYTEQTRWEPDVPVAARRVPCPIASHVPSVGASALLGMAAGGAVEQLWHRSAGRLFS